MFKKCQLLMLEKGVYSYFAYAGPFRVLMDFDKRKAVKAFTRATPKRDQEERHFVAWLARERYIEDAGTEHWYLGDWDFSPLAFQEAADDDNASPLNTGWGIRFERTAKAQTKYDAEQDAIRKKRREEYDNSDPLSNMTTGLPGMSIGSPFLPPKSG